MANLQRKEIAEKWVQFAKGNFYDKEFPEYQNYSPINNEQFAQQLYGALRSADENSLQNVYVVPPSGNDIAVAINDRLKKASHR